MEMNNEAIYYMNKIVGLAKEINSLEEECEKKTGIHICSNSVRFDFLDQKMTIQTSNCIDKIGLPVQIEETGRLKIAEVNGYQVIEVIDKCTE